MSFILSRHHDKFTLMLTSTTTFFFSAMTKMQQRPKIGAYVQVSIIPMLCLLS